MEEHHAPHGEPIEPGQPADGSPSSHAPAPEGDPVEGAGVAPALHPVEAALAAIREAVETIQTATTWSLPEERFRALVVEGASVKAMLESAWLGLVRDLDLRPFLVPGAKPDKCAQWYLSHRLTKTGAEAAADVAAARALDPDGDPVEGGMPELAEAFAAGLVSRRHVDVAVRARARIPQHLLRAVDEDGVSGAEKVDAFLAEHAQQHAPATVETIGRLILQAVDPDGVDRFDPLAYQRRKLSLVSDGTGMLLGRFQVPAAQGAGLKAALEHYARPSSEESVDPDGQQTLVPDLRTRGQRLADALCAIGAAAMSPDVTAPGEPPHVLLVATVDQVEAAHAHHADRVAAADGSAGASAGGAGGVGGENPGLGPVSPATLALLSCDSVLEPVVLDRRGAVLNLGRAARTVTPSQRKALIVRDRGCVIPGCAAEPRFCQAHHVTYWRHGGRTDLDNLALLCHRHHTETHLGLWTLHLVDGIAWATPPPFLDPWRRRHRNTTWDAHTQARHLGEQLRLHTDHPPWGASAA